MSIIYYSEEEKFFATGGVDLRAAKGLQRATSSAMSGDRGSNSDATTASFNGKHNYSITQRED